MLTKLATWTWKSISGSSVVGYAFAGNHSWPPSWVGAQFRLEVISGSIAPIEASRQSLSLRTGTNWQQVVPVPGTMALEVPQSFKGFFASGVNAEDGGLGRLSNATFSEIDSLGNRATAG